MKQKLRAPKRALGLLIIAAAAVAVALTAGSSARAGGFVGVTQGPGAALLPATAFGNTPPGTPEAVSFILRAQNLGDLENKVQNGWSGRFLSVRDFAQQYGQSQANIDALEQYLAGFGITSTVTADQLELQTQGTAGEYDDALQVQQQQFQVNPGPVYKGAPDRKPMMVHGTKQTPLLPKNLAAFTLSILGLSSYPTQTSSLLGVPSAAKPQAAGSSALPNTALVPSDFATRYNLDPVYAKGNGAGTTIGIVTLASVDPNVVSAFWNNIGLTGAQASANRITLENVDGGSGPVNERFGSDETTLDAQQSGALAPGANVRVYQAPNTDFGFVDAYYQAASDNIADTVSASWGLSETAIQFEINGGFEDPNYVQSFDQAFLEMAAQGQSNFNSSADQGAYPASADLGSTNLAIVNPTDSPWMTSAGGTTLPGTLKFHGGTISVTIPAERTWAWDWLWPVIAQENNVPTEDVVKSFVVGTGGGFSSFYATPNYQQGVRGTHNFSAVPYLTPTAFVQQFGLTLPTDWNVDVTPPTITGNATGRAVPDLSTDADPETGYQVLYTFGDSCLFAQPTPCTSPPPPSVEQFGGTSFVAPQLNGVTAVYDSVVGHRLGFWNPQIYKFAKMGPRSPFTPLDTPGTSNDNLFYSGTPHNLYNAGSGLGVPDLAKLEQDFAHPGPGQH
jgi:subtilase family serine protease